MVVPAAYQVKAPFGRDLGGVSPRLFSQQKESQYDSWLTVGVTDGDKTRALSSIGIDFGGWDQSNQLTVEDGAVFWLKSSLGAHDTAVLAQLTVAKAWTGDAVMNIGGRTFSRRASEAHFFVRDLHFKMPPSPSQRPSPSPSPSSSSLSPPPPPSSPVHWPEPLVDISFVKGKGGLSDRSSHKRSLTYSHGSTSKGSTSSGIHFDGDNDGVTIQSFDYASDGAFTISFWFMKELCTSGVFEYLFSDHETVGKRMWDTSYLDIYMGCVDKTKQTGGGSIVRYWLRDTAGQEAMFDWPLADADSFDKITKVWIHILMTVSPSAVVTYENGKAVPAGQYLFEAQSLPSNSNLASNGPAR